MISYKNEDRLMAVLEDIVKAIKGTNNTCPWCHQVLMRACLNPQCQQSVKLDYDEPEEDLEKV